MPRRVSGNEKVAIQERRSVIARMYVQGYAQWPIAKLLGIDQSTVSRELESIREEWLKTRTLDYTVKVAREVAGLDMQESCLWEAWYNSCKQDVITTVTRKKRLIAERVDDDATDQPKKRRRKGPSKLTTVEENEKTETRQLIGDPRFMAEITRVRELRCKLLGLLEDEPLQPAVVNIWQQLQEARFDRDEDTIEERLKQIESKPISGFIDVTNTAVVDSSIRKDGATNTSETVGTNDPPADTSTTN